MSDRNKTDITNLITQGVTLWLDGKGFKPVETEVPVAGSWIADVAGVCCPTQTELIEMRLLRRPPKTPRWDSNSAVKENAHKLHDVWRAERDALPKQISITVEVKTSVADFRRDGKWAREFPTNLCYLAVPANLVEATRYPKGWGLLLFSKDGGTLLKAVPGELRAVSDTQQLNAVLAIAVCRDHRTRHARLREFQKEVRLQDGERKNLQRISNAVSFVIDIINGRPIAEAKELHGFRGELNPYVLEQLAAVQKSHGCAEFQRKVHRWSQMTFPHQTPASKFAHLIREIKELGADLKDGKEMADCFLLLLGLAEMAGVDLMAEARAKFEINRNRRWGPPDAQGVSSHVEELAPPR
jgi:NTP pyrophosphatase (non-canonical NTP hydrolase)